MCPCGYVYVSADALGSVRRGHQILCIWTYRQLWAAQCDAMNWIWVLYKSCLKLGMVAHAFNPSTRKAEAGEFLSSRPVWSIEWVPGQPGIYRETLSQKGAGEMAQRLRTPTALPKVLSSNPSNHVVAIRNKIWCSLLECLKTATFYLHIK